MRTPGGEARRRSAALGIVLALATLAFPALALGLPTVTVRGRAVPIPGFPHTGNFFGAGAAVHAEVTISGSEYGGFPPPLIGINVYLPAGVKIHSAGFKTCSEATLKNVGAKGCPKGAAAGPIGHARGVVAFGTERVQEEVTIASFFTMGGLLFYTEGHTPVQLEIVSGGQLVHPGGAGGFGPEFTGAIPLVETVPGAPDASVESIDITIGAAIRLHGRTVYYGTVPRSCPRGGFRAKAEFTFAQSGDPAMPETVTVPVTAPCPKR